MSIRVKTIGPLLACGLGAAAPLHAARASEIEAGPLWHRFSLTLSPGSREEAVGPLWYLEQKETQKTYAIPPLFSYTRDPALEYKEIDVAYPLLTYDRFGSEYRLQLMQVLSFAGGSNQKDETSRRYTLFPFYFSQRSRDPARNYTAVMPFGGRMQNRLFRDEIAFVMAPLYLRSRKQDVVTENYLYPLFHTRHGNSLNGWQLWPFYGEEHKGVTTKTNSIEEVEIVGGHEKYFALWPLFFRQRLGIGTENPQTNTVVLPLVSRQRSPNRDSTTYLWPFFTYTDDRVQKYHEYGAPWPLISFARGEGKRMDRVWPLYSHAQKPDGPKPEMETRFYLWPLYKQNTFHGDQLYRDRKRVLFYLYSDVVEQAPGATNGLRRTDLWPLFTARRDKDDTERLQMLAVLEPFLPNNKSIERNYSHLWSLWRSEKNPKTGRSSESALWNLYRHEKTPESRKCSFLFGLFRYESGPAGKKWRLFYIPFGKTKPVPTQPDQSRK